MTIPASAAAWFLPFVLPICFYVAFTDMRYMRIRNCAVYTLALAFVVVGLFVLPPWSGPWLPGNVGPLAFSLPVYAWQLLHIPVVLFIGILLNAAGIMGAGDAKFCAAASAFIWVADLMVLTMILLASILGSFASHRLIKHTALRQVAPHWRSWRRKKFPMGLTLAGCLWIYLALGIIYGS